MGKIIIKNAVVRKSGYLYYIDGKGNICEAKLARAEKKKDIKKRARWKLLFLESQPTLKECLHIWKKSILQQEKEWKF